MNGENKGGVHWSFWIIGAVALVWNVMGSINFFAQMNADVVASMPESYRLVIADRPAWVTGAFAIAVLGGAVGSLLLLLKKSTAYYVFIASLLGVIVTMAHAVSLASSAIDFNSVFVGALMSLVVAAILVWYSRWAKNKRWIN